MKTASVKDIAEMFGIAAIVASLIFVGLQLNQSQDIAVATQYQERANAALSFFQTQMQNERALKAQGQRVFQKIDSGNDQPALKKLFSEGTLEDLGFAHFYLRSNFTMLDNYQFQYENGFMTEDAWQGFRTIIHGILSDEVNAEIYLMDTKRYRPSFQRVCSELLAEIEVGLI